MCSQVDGFRVCEVVDGFLSTCSGKFESHLLGLDYVREFEVSDAIGIDPSPDDLRWLSHHRLKSVDFSVEDSERQVVVLALEYAHCWLCTTDCVALFGRIGEEVVGSDAEALALLNEEV